MLRIFISLLASSFISVTAHAQQEDFLIRVERDTIVTISHPSGSLTQYTQHELMSFLDSKANLDIASLRLEASPYYDSVYQQIEQLNIPFDDTRFNLLKRATQQGVLKDSDFEAIFQTVNEAHLFTENKVNIKKISFNHGEGDFDEYAIIVGPCSVGWESEVYFFKGPKLIEKHEVFHRTDLDLNFFKADNGEIIVHYSRNFGGGRGFLQYNDFFYQYDEHGMTPVLNMLQNSLLDGTEIHRTRWFKSEIIETTPLTMEIVYDYSFPDSLHYESVDIESNTSVVQFDWNIELQQYELKEKSELTADQILSYYPDIGSDFFLRLNYTKLRSIINNGTKAKREATLRYLALVLDEKKTTPQ